MLQGFETADDAAVYRINDDQAGVLTLDFFTPVVDDPYEYGCAAAANALSDVFAMGARVVCAMNILAFPADLGTDIVGEVIRGGADKVAEAGGVTVGGHTIDDDEPKYGLSVFGMVHPDRIIRNGGVEPGDLLYYTKRIGTGIMNSALTAGLETPETMRPVIEQMMELNKAAGEAMMEVLPHAATDVTGFGLLGHLHEMLAASNCGAKIRFDALPLFDNVWEHSCEYCRPGKSFDLVEWAEDFTTAPGLSADEFDNRMGVLCDPQTSGGILVALPHEKAQAFEDAYYARAGRRPWLIGNATTGPAGTVKVV